jgi:hypothetical protein
MMTGMEKQNQIKRKLSRSDAIEYVKSILAASDNLNRSALADQLCDHFRFLDFRKQRQRAGCLKALRELERAGHFVLPKPVDTYKPGKPRRVSKPLSEPKRVPDTAGEIKELQLILVASEDQMRIWNELMIRDHPLGAGPLVGRQLYYLVKSEQGWLGGLGFSSAAIHLEARDRWIGWDWKIRRDNLQQIVCMSRFLICSGIRCQNLASKVLGMVTRQFPEDYAKRYGYSPLLLESFVDTRYYNGTCYKAANWLKVGCSKGWGRQGLENGGEKSLKDIYVFPLDDNFRLKLGLSERCGQGALEISACIDNDRWAEMEFGEAPIGDKRLSNRLVEIARNLAQDPGRAYCGLTAGDWSKTKAYYRFVDKPDDSAVSMQNLLEPHRNCTIRRMKAQPVVLCIQDGTDFNFSSLDQCEGLGAIGKNQTGAVSKGLHMHSMVALTTRGLPLGILRAECIAPPLKAVKKRRACNVPIEEKTSFQWVKGVRDTMEIKAHMPQTKVVNVMDREGDFFELFYDRQAHCQGVDLLVRAKYDRKTVGDVKLFDFIRQSRSRLQVRMQVPRQSARPKKSKQKARPKRPARTATVSVRYEPVYLKPPLEFKDSDQPLSMWIIHVKEDHPPQDTDALEWFLLTTLEMKSDAVALNCIQWYCLRWRIEDWHRVLKSGCAVEKLAHKTANRLRRAIAINLVVAWRLTLMTLLGRETPDLPPDVLFTEMEIEMLKAYAKKKNTASR